MLFLLTSAKSKFAPIQMRNNNKSNTTKQYFQVFSPCNRCTTLLFATSYMTKPYLRIMSELSVNNKKKRTTSNSDLHTFFNPSSCLSVTTVSLLSSFLYLFTRPIFELQSIFPRKLTTALHNVFSNFLRKQLQIEINLIEQMVGKCWKSNRYEIVK